MQRDIAAGDFIEHAEFSGNLYGTRWATAGVLSLPGALPLAGPRQGVL